MSKHDLYNDEVTAALIVEIISFTGISFTSNFHTALGQFINYLFALKSEEPDRRLF